jgi:branched-chain amino acid transport system substrate-binding protein
VRVGLIFPFSGPFAAWGIAFERSIQYGVDQINAQGGLKADGKTYKVKLISYDDKGWVPSENLKMVRKAVFEDKVSVIFNTSTAEVQKAIGPFTTKNKILVLSWGAGAQSPERPYLIGVDTGWPTNGVSLWTYLRENHPDVQKVAIFNPDYPPGQQGRTWREIGAKAAGYEIVFMDWYPLETVDFYPFVTRILKAKPDFISTDTVPASQLASIVKACKDLGYTGMFMTEQTDFELILKKVPADYIEGFLSSYPEGTKDDTMAPQLIRDFRAHYDKNWPGEWNPYNPMPYGDILTWKIGVEAAGSVDPTAVRDALLATNPIEHPVWGTAYWGGKEIWGANTQLFTDNVVVRFHGGKNLMVAKYSYSDWYQKNKDLVVSTMKREGWMGSQED